MTLAPNGDHAVLVRNVGAIRMDLDRVETVSATALGGADTFTVGDLTGTDVTAANVDPSAFAGGGGDAQLDDVIVNGTNRADHIAVSAQGQSLVVDGLHTTTRITGAEPTDRLHVNSGGGNDTVNVGGGVAALITASVDLGTGQR